MASITRDLHSRIAIRTAVPKDVPQILSLLNASFRTPTDEAVWRWYVHGNPFGATRVYLAVDTENGALVGVFAFTPVPLRMHGKPVLGSSGHHLCLNAAWRGGLVFMAMSRAALQGEADAGVTLGLGVPNRRSHEPQKKLLQWKDLMVLDRLRKLQPAGRPHRCLPIGNFDAAFDIFYQRLSRGFAFCIEKNAAWMNWRFFERPGSPYTAFAAATDSRLTGYVVLKRWREPDGYTKAHIVDFHALDNDTACELIAAAESYAGDCGEIDLWAAPGYPYRSCLEAAGFSSVPDARQPVIAKTLNGPELPLTPGPASLAYADADFVY